MDFDHFSILQAVFDSTAEGILVVGSDGKIIQFNKRFLELWKVPAELIEHKDDQKVLKHVLSELLHPFAFVEKIKDLYDNPDAVSNDELKFKDGRVFERFSRPLKMNDQTVGRLWNFRDVTEIKKNEQVLEAITELSPDIISIVDAQGNLVYNSAAAERIHGYSNEEMIGINTLDLIHEDDRNYVTEELNKLLDNPGQLTTVQYRYRNKDGSFSWMEATAYNLVQNPLINGVVTISREIEKRKQLEMDLKDALSLRDDFLSIASHELKTPLTSIKLQLQMMMRSQLLQKSQSDQNLRSESLAHLLDQVSSLQGLIEDLLSVSKIRTGHLLLVTKEEDLSHNVELLIERYRGLFQEANCSLKMDIEKNLILTYDRARMDQVFINLMANAIKYAPNSLVEMSLKKVEGFVEFTIQDQGPGIATDKHELIFGRFERAFSTSYTSGLGIGLFISKNIVEGHQGTIQVFSEVGKGARFVVRLPQN